MIFFYQQIHLILNIQNVKIYSHTLHGTQYTHHNLRHMPQQYCITYNDVALLNISTKG